MTNHPHRLQCDAVLFDLDGVLIDSTTCVVRHWQYWAGLHNLDFDRIMQHAHGVRTVETIRFIAPHLDAEAEAGQFEARELLDTDGVTAIQGAYPLVAALPEDAWAIVTSGSRALATARLRKAGLPVPHTLITADDVRQGKPSPEPYLTAASRLGLAPQNCVVIEDAPAGIAAGKQAGMRVIGVASTHTRAELLENGVDFVVDRLAQLTIRAAASGPRLVIEMI